MALIYPILDFVSLFKARRALISSQIWALTNSKFSIWMCSSNLHETSNVWNGPIFAKIEVSSFRIGPWHRINNGNGTPNSPSQLSGGAHVSPKGIRSKDIRCQLMHRAAQDLKTDTIVRLKSSALSNQEPRCKKELHFFPFVILAI